MAASKSGFMKDALILFAITLVSGLCLGVVYDVTKAPIEAATIAANNATYKQVLPEAESFDDVEGSTEKIAETADEIANLGFGGVAIESVLEAKDASGEVVGHVINSLSNDSYGGAVKLSIGFDADGTITGVGIRETSDTPGLGLKAKGLGGAAAAGCGIPHDPHICSCILSAFYVLAVSYCLSRLKFKMRKPYMNMAMILGLFPGFMSMIAVYFILKAMGLTEGNLIKLALILCYSGGAGLGFQIAKGFFDTIPVAIDEAALLDGCTRWQIFSKITLPLSKPIIVYTVLTSFMAPWLDFIFAKVICRANSDQYTIAIGLWKMLEKEYIDSWYTSFAAGAVLISIPIAILFLFMQRYYVDGVSGAVKG